MTTLDQGVAPPNEAPVITTGVTPAPAGQESGVANVNLDYDPNFKQVVRSVVAPTPENNIKAAGIISRREKESADEHPNEQMQLGKMVISLLQGKVGEAYKWYNGGGVSYEQGNDVFGNEYMVSKNERGFTNKYKIVQPDGKTRDLTEDERKQLLQRGGLITQTNLNALKTAGWKAAEDASVEAAKGFNSQLRASQTAAYAASNVANATNNNIDEEIKLGFKLKNALGAISQMDPKQRQQLFQFANRYNTNSENLRQSQEKAGGASASGQQQVGVSPGGVGVSVGAAQAARASETNTAAGGRESTLQEQQNLETAMRGMLAGSVKSPEEFNALMRLVSLNQMNNQAAKEIPNEVKPSGYKDVPPVDVFSGGLDSLLQTRYAQQANNALVAAWNSELYKAQRDQITSGKTYSPAELQEKFKNSDIVKGIINRTIYKTEKILGRESSLKKGDVIMDSNGKLVPIE